MGGGRLSGECGERPSLRTNFSMLLGGVLEARLLVGQPSDTHRKELDEQHEATQDRQRPV